MLFANVFQQVTHNHNNIVIYKGIKDTFCIMEFDISLDDIILIFHLRLNSYFSQTRRKQESKKA